MKDSISFWVIEDARLLRQKLINEGWQKTSKKWRGNLKINF